MASPGKDEANVRDAMKGYWDHWVKDAAQSGNFLKVMVSEDDVDKAKDIHESDLAEITGLLPDLTGMNVLELASGVGFVYNVCVCVCERYYIYISNYIYYMI